MEGDCSICVSTEAATADSVPQDILLQFETAASKTQAAVTRQGDRAVAYLEQSSIFQN